MKNRTEKGQCDYFLHNPKDAKIYFRQNNTSNTSTTVINESFRYELIFSMFLKMSFRKLSLFYRIKFNSPKSLWFIRVNDSL